MEEALDSRRPLHLDHHGHVLQVIKRVTRIYLLSMLRTAG